MFSLRNSLFLVVTHVIPGKILDIRMRIQRATKGYADTDVWNFNDWFSTVVPKMLKDLRDKSIGYPGGMRGIKDEKDWNRVLTEIIEGLELYRKADEAELVFETEEQLYYPSGTRVLTFNHFTNKGNNNWKGKPAEIGSVGRFLLSKEEKKKFNKAMQLFVFYWPCMWD